ncbi:MAG: hypothetical protein GXP24_14785 [Planctomycetes bacterium]|nr:hypothetical protein [Planctomycetota bacterium]
MFQPRILSARILSALWVTLIIGLAPVIGLAPPLSTNIASAASLESAQMGIPGKVSGVAIAPGQSATGWRFEVSVPFQVESIGGHLYGSDQQPIYGAILALDSITALPQGLPFNLDEVVASTTFVPPSPSDEIIVPLSVTLAPGAYALLFGTDALGATGIAAVPNSTSEQPDIPPTTIDSYITYGIPRPNAPQEWRERLGSGRRLFVRGTTVGLSADFDIDGDVDASDLALWETSFGTNVFADSNGDGLSDGGDFLTWQRQWTGNETETSQSVPEPVTGFLGWTGALGFLALSGRRSRRWEF